MSDIMGSARTARGKVNMVVLVTAFVLCIINVNTYNQCVNKTEDYSTFKSDSLVSLSYIGSIVVIILVVLLFLYDIGIILNLIK
jgi:hypothetical protein